MGKGGRGGFSGGPELGMCVQGMTEFGACLVLGGSSDPNSNSVLLSGYDQEDQVRLWQLPDFTDRGRLPGITSTRALQCCQVGTFEDPPTPARPPSPPRPPPITARTSLLGPLLKTLSRAVLQL